jgi:hypothetical protein
MECIRVDKSEVLFNKLTESPNTKLEIFDQKLKDFFDGRLDALPSVEEYKAALDEYGQGKELSMRSALTVGAPVGAVAALPIGLLAGVGGNLKQKALSALAALAGGALAAGSIAASNADRRLIRKVMADSESYTAQREIADRYREAISDIPYIHGKYGRGYN